MPANLQNPPATGKPLTDMEREKLRAMKQNAPAAPSVSDVSGGLVQPTAQPGPVQQGVDAMNASVRPPRPSSPGAESQWDKAGQNFSHTWGNPNRPNPTLWSDAGNLVAGVGHSIGGATLDIADNLKSGYGKVADSGTGRYLALPQVSPTAPAEKPAVTMADRIPLDQRDVPSTADDLKSKPAEPGVNKMFAPDFTARILRDLQYRQAYGATHGQSPEALKADYERTMAALGEVQSTFQQYDDRRRAKAAGLVHNNGLVERSLPIDENGKFLAGAGSMTDERGKITNLPELGEGTKGFDQRGRASMIYHPQPGVTVYKPLSNQVTGPVDTEAMARQALDDRKTQEQARAIDLAVAQQSGDKVMEKAILDGTYNPSAKGTISGVPAQKYLEDNSLLMYDRGLTDPDSPAGQINQAINQRIRNNQSFGDLLQKLSAAAAAPGFNRSDVVLRPGPDASKFKGLVEQGNIDLGNRPILRNADGTVSTVKSISIREGEGKDAREILIPTVATDENGNPVELSQQEAINRYHTTGEHLGKFKSSAEADAYAQALHESQAKYYRGAENYTSDGIPQVEATPESAAKYAAERRQVQQALSPLPSREQMEAGFSVPNTRYSMGRFANSPGQTPVNGSVKLPGIKSFTDQLRTQQQAEQARWAQINAQKQMEEAMKPIPDNDPMRTAKIARDRGEAARAIAISKGEDPNDEQVLAKYLPDPTGMAANDRTRELNAMALQHLRGDSLENVVRTAILNNASGSRYDQRQNVKTADLIKDTSAVDARDAAIDSAKERQDARKDKEEAREGEKAQKRINNLTRRQDDAKKAVEAITKEMAALREKSLDGKTPGAKKSLDELEAQRVKRQAEVDDLQKRLNKEEGVDDEVKTEQAGNITPQPKGEPLPPVDQLKNGVVYTNANGVKARWDAKLKQLIPL
jgi:hypothetical protein